jgi:hypothetical protein
MRRAQVFMCAKLFLSGREDITDDEKSGVLTS